MRLKLVLLLLPKFSLVVPNEWVILLYQAILKISSEAKYITTPVVDPITKSYPFVY